MTVLELSSMKMSSIILEKLSSVLLVHRFYVDDI